MVNTTVRFSVLGVPASLLCTVLGSCEPRLERGGPIIRDSAGIEIVENAGAHTATAEHWEVSQQPILELGARDGAGPQQFTRVAGAVRLSNGVVVVLDMMTAELRFFDVTGEHIRTVGRRGDGPGEFRYPQSLVRMRGDTLGVWDAQRRALELFAMNGEYLARRQMIDRQAFPEVTWASSCFTTLPVLRDGSVLRCLHEEGVTRSAGVDPPEGLVRGGVRLAAIPPSLDRLDTLGIYPGNEHYVLHLGGGAIQDGSHAFLARSHVAAGHSPGHLFIAAGPEYAIEVWDLHQGLIRMIRRTEARRAPTATEAERAWEVALADVSSDLHARIRSIMSDVGLLPAIHGLAAGPSGELWVKREPLPGLPGAALFDVFDAAGQFIGEVSLETDLTLLEVGADYLLGTWNDELDVPYVFEFALNRGS